MQSRLSKTLHRISCLAIPFFLGGLALVNYAFLLRPENHREILGPGLVLFGFGFSFEALQDSQRMGTFGEKLLRNRVFVQGVSG